MMPQLILLTCRTCGVQDVPRLDAGSGPHAARAVCPHCQTFIKWLGKPQPKERPLMMESVNYWLVSGQLERDPSVRFREDGVCHCTGSLRLDDQNAQGTIFTTYVPFEAYNKVGERMGTYHAHDSVLLQGKAFWRKYHTKTGEERSGLALLVQKSSLLAAAEVPV
jgi:hypothetical protein